MVTIGMNYEVLEGKDEPFEKKFAIVLGAMKDTAGHRSTYLYKDVFSERSYLVISEWNTRATFDDFVRSETFRKVTDWGITAILATRPSHQVYGESAELPSAAASPAR